MRLAEIDEWNGSMLVALEQEYGNRRIADQGVQRVIADQVRMAWRSYVMFHGGQDPGSLEWSLPSGPPKKKKSLGLRSVVSRALRGS